MLHTKFQGYRPFDSGEEDFLKFLPYMGMAAILVMWPGPFEQIQFKMSSFKSNENIHKKEDGPYYVVSANKASSVTL